MGVKNLKYYIICDIKIYYLKELIEMKLKVTLLTALLLISSVTAAFAYIDISSVQIYPGETIKSTRELSLSSSGNLNIYVINQGAEGNDDPIEYYVKSSSGDIITQGTIDAYNDYARNYSRSVPAGKYRLYLSCPTAKCIGYGALKAY
jgi:hypothetical protein